MSTTSVIALLMLLVGCKSSTSEPADGNISGRLDLGSAEVTDAPIADAAAPDSRLIVCSAGEVRLPEGRCVAPSLGAACAPGQVRRLSGECWTPTPDCRDGWCNVPVAWYLMGAGGIRFDDFHPMRLVRTPGRFRIMQAEVTISLWESVTGEAVAPAIKKVCGPDCPATYLNQWAMLDFANRLSRRAGLTPCYLLEGCSEAVPSRMMCARGTALGPECTGYRLPTEVEWELAARAGTLTCVVSGENTAGFGDPCGYKGSPVWEDAWVCGNSETTYPGCSNCDQVNSHAPDLEVPIPTCCGVHPVAQKKQNPFGLFDMAGNVAEVTSSRFIAQESPGPPTSDALWADGVSYMRSFGPEDGFAIRGGSFLQPNMYACLTTRFASKLKYDTAQLSYDFLGFRLVQSLPDDER